MHLRGAATQQIDEGGVEGHDGVPQVDAVLLLLLLTTKPANTKTGFHIILISNA